jgi:hypothetical protein
MRWDAANPRVGVDPDFCWVDPLPPGFRDGEVDSLRLWLPGHRTARVKALEAELAALRAK